jgi:hypothetical protein
MNKSYKLEQISNVMVMIVMIPAVLIIGGAIIKNSTTTVWATLGLSALSCLTLAFMIWSIIRIKNSKLDQTTKALWSLVILLFPVIGAIVSVYMTTDEINGKTT